MFDYQRAYPFLSPTATPSYPKYAALGSGFPTTSSLQVEESPGSRTVASKDFWDITYILYAYHMYVVECNAM
jgi:hypothetical protein